MSAIAEFYKIEISKLNELKEAATAQGKPQGEAEDSYFDFLDEKAEKLKEYDWSGYIYATLLPYLDENGIAILDSEYNDIAMYLSEAKDCTHIILTNSHKVDYLDKLLPSLFNTEELAAFYNEFNADDDDESGEAMLNAIEVLYENLQKVDNDHIILLGIF